MKYLEDPQTLSVYSVWTLTLPPPYWTLTYRWSYSYRVKCGRSGVQNIHMFDYCQYHNMYEDVFLTSFLPYTQELWLLSRS